MWWCIRYFTIFGVTGLVLWGRFSRALEHWCTHLLLWVRGGSCLCLHSPLGFSLTLISVPGSWHGGLCSLQPLSQLARVPCCFVSGAEPQASCLGAPAQGWSRRSSIAGALAPREGPALDCEASCVTPMVSVAFLLKAEKEKSEKSLWSGDCSVFSDFFSNPLDQREKNQAWLVIPALPLLQHPESWSEGSPCASAMLNDGSEVASHSVTALASPHRQRFLWLAVEMHEGFITQNDANDTVKVLTKMPVLRCSAAFAAPHYLVGSY